MKEGIKPKFLDKQFVVIEEANPPLKMKVVVPLVQQSEQVEQAATEPLNLPLVLTTQETIMVEKNETTTVVVAPDRTKTKQALALVTNDVVLDLEAALISTQMPNPASAS